MSRPASVIELTEQEEETLQAWRRAGTTGHWLVQRAQIVLAAAQGESTQAIAERMGCPSSFVSVWRQRFARERLQGLQDAPRSGRPRVYAETDERRVLQKLDEPPPEGYATWNGNLLAQALDLSADYVWRVLRQHGIQLQRRRSWCVSTDPEFSAKAADIVGLYLEPPENALVICMDEKPSIQALERAQGWLKLPNGKALTGRSHEYKRHGTTNLFAALEVATGQVQVGHYARKRRREFLHFMNELVAGHSREVELHVILDNFKTHKPKHDRWLQRHPNVHFHFTPTHGSWLNQVEIWFSLLWRHALRGASHTSPRQVRQAIDRYLSAYLQQAHPFEWTKRSIHPSRLKPNYADLRK
jgi:transposase